MSSTGSSGSPRSSGSTPNFPGAVGITHLRVYGDSESNRRGGGSPHVHIASSEAYIPTSGAGKVEMLTGNGREVHDLVPGSVVWFEPGVIHRLIPESDVLEILCIMQNAGLPESGDAVMTLPPAYLRDAEAYALGVQLPKAQPEVMLEAAYDRRDLALEGYRLLMEEFDVRGPQAIDEFLGKAIAIVRPSLEQWRSLWRERPLEEVTLTQSRLDHVSHGSTAELLRARVGAMQPAEDHPHFGMCGRLETFIPEGWTR